MRLFIIDRLYSTSFRCRQLFRAVLSSKTFPLVLLCLFIRQGFAIGQPQFIENTHSEGSFPIVQENIAANIYVDTNDFAGVAIAADNLRADVIVSPAVHRQSFIKKMAWERT